MFIEAKKIIGLPVASVEEESKVGEILQLVIDPQNGTLLGFLVKTNGFFDTVKALSVIDVRDWDPQGLVITSVDNIVALDEIIRIKEIFDQKIIILGFKAQTESGKSLGSIDNLLIDTENLVVAKYYVKNILTGDERVFLANSVVKIENKTVIFQDDEKSLPVGAQSAVV